MILEGTSPTNPTTFGEQLRGLREAAEVPLEAICDETKIACRLLEALEAGDFSLLPEKIFSRSFVKQYAEAIGGDSSRLVKDFDEAWARFETESGSFRVEAFQEPPPVRPIRWGFWFPISVGFVILMSAAVVILSGSDPAQEALVETPRSTVRGENPPVTPVGAPVVPSPIPDEETAAGVGGPIALSVRVDPTKECWIHYRDREGRTDQRLLPGGSNLQLELNGPVKLTVGNAGAATLVVGGVEYADLGVPGQVVHTEVSSDGVRALGVGDPS